MGRTTKLNEETHEKIVAMIRAGNYPEVAAQVAGISRKTYYEWMKRGENEPGIYREFRDAVKEAKGAAEAHAVAIIRKAALDGTWQAAAWFLERSKPERWRRRENVEVTGKDGGPVEQRITSDTERQQVSAMIDELAARRARKEAG